MEEKKYEMRLIEKDVSFEFNGNKFDFTISNRTTPSEFVKGVSNAVDIMFSKKDETYAGYMAWVYDFACRTAVISMFTNIDTDIDLDQLWFFVYYSPAFDMVMDACPDEAQLLLDAIDDAVELKKDYLVHKSDMVEMFTDMLDKFDLSGFGDLDLSALSDFLSNAQGLTGSELVQGIANGLGKVFGDNKDNSSIPETVIGSQRQDKKN